MMIPRTMLPLRTTRAAGRAGLLALALTTAACNRGGDTTDPSAAPTAPATAAAPGAPTPTAVAASLTLEHIDLLPANPALVVQLDWAGAMARLREISGRFGVELSDDDLRNAIQSFSDAADMPSNLRDNLNLLALRTITLAVYADPQTLEEQGVVIFGRDAFTDAPADGERRPMEGEDRSEIAGFGGHVLIGRSDVLDRVFGEGEKLTQASLFAGFDGLSDNALGLIVFPSNSPLLEDIRSDLPGNLTVNRFAASFTAAGAVHVALDAPDASLITNALGGAQQTLRGMVDSLRTSSALDGSLAAERRALAAYATLALDSLWSTVSLSTSGTVTRLSVAAPTCGELPPAILAAVAIGVAQYTNSDASAPFQPSQARLASTCEAMQGPPTNLRRDLARFGMGPNGSEGVVFHFDMGAALRVFAPTMGGMLPFAMDHAAIREALGDTLFGLRPWDGSDNTMVSAVWADSQQFVASVPPAFHSWVIQAAGTPLPGEAAEGMGTLVYIDPAYRAVALDREAAPGVYADAIATVPDVSFLAVVIPAAQLSTLRPLVADMPGIAGVMDATRAVTVAFDPDYATHLRLLVTGNASGHANAVNEAIDGFVATMIGELDLDGLSPDLFRGLLGQFRAQAEGDTLVALDLGNLAPFIPVLTSLGAVGAMMPGSAGGGWDDPYDSEYIPVDPPMDAWGTGVPTGLGDIDDQPALPVAGDDKP